MNLGEKPKTLFCYICGREFGTSSLGIHLKKCPKKFENEQIKKEPKNRRKCPDPPQELPAILSGQYGPQLMEIYNQKASNIHKYQSLAACKYCGRTFNEESVKVHESGCSKKDKNGGSRLSEAASKALGGGDGWKLPQENLKKPRVLSCCVCGRQFGLTSLKIHYPKCIEKFTNVENLKPKSERKPVPKFTDDQLELINRKEDWTEEEIQEFNKHASLNYRDNAMTQCPNCKRKFFAEAFEKHKKNCVLINGDKGGGLDKKSQSQKAYNLPSDNNFKKPRTLTCCVCGRQFGLTSLKIHYPQCIEKFNSEQALKPKNERKVSPTFSEDQLQMVNNKTDWTSEEIEQFNQHANGNYRENAMTQCPNCKRKFFAQSYLKHKKNCILINGDKGSESSDRPASSKMKSTQSNWKKPRVLMCHICGRQFGLTSLLIHQKRCEIKFTNEEKKKSVDERRPLPIFPEQQLARFDLQNAEGWKQNTIEQYNKIANQVYRSESLSACPICNRKFFQQSLPKHLKYCQKNQERQNKNSQTKNPSTLRESQSVENVSKILQSNKKHETHSSEKDNIKKISSQSSQKLKKLGGPMLKKVKNNSKKLFDEQQNLSQQEKQQKVTPINSTSQIIHQQKNESLLSSPEKQPLLRKSMIKAIGNNNKIQQLANEKVQQVDPELEETCKNESMKKSMFDYNMLQSKLNQIKNEENRHNQGQGDVDMGKKNRVIENISHKQKQFDQQFIQGEKRQNQVLDEQQQKQQERNEKLQNKSENIRPKEQLIGKKINDQQQKTQQLNKNEDEFNVDQNDSLDMQNLLQKQKKFPSLKNPLQDRKQHTENNWIKSSVQRTKNIQQNIVDNKQKLQQYFPEQKELTNPSQKVIDDNRIIQSRQGTISRDTIGKWTKSRGSSRNKLRSTHSDLKFAPPETENQIISQKIADGNIQSKKLNNNNKYEVQSSIPPTALKKTISVESQKNTKKNDIVSPSSKMASTKGFAAPRKKQQQMIQNMKECKVCSRKFAEDRIDKHEKICQQTSEKQEKIRLNNLKYSMKKTQSQNIQNPNVLNEKKTSENQLQKSQKSQNEFIREILSPEQKVRKKMGFAAPRQKQEQMEMKMVECRGCRRKFADDRIQKHQKVCKKAQQILESGKKPFIAGGVGAENQKVLVQDIAGQNQEKKSLVRVPCPHCGRKFAQERLEKHQQICKAQQIRSGKNNDNHKKNDVDNKKKLQKRESQYNIDIEKIQTEKEVAQKIQLQNCEKCGRNFNTERIEKHREVCKGTKNLGNSKNSSTGFRSGRTETYSSQSRKQEDEKKVGYNLEKLQGSTQVIKQTDDRMECKQCSKKIAADRMQKHLNICKVQPYDEKDLKNRTGSKFAKKPPTSIAPLNKKNQVPPLTKGKTKGQKVEQNSSPEKQQKISNQPQKKTPKLKPIQPINTPKGINKSNQKSQSPKKIDLPINGQDQFVDEDLQECQKCFRKFKSERLQKHQQICKGNNKLKKISSNKKPIPQQNTPLKQTPQVTSQNNQQISNKMKNSPQNPKINNQQLRKTKNQFYNMIKDLKGKKIQEEQIDKQLQTQLQEIQRTSIITRKKQNKIHESVDIPRKKNSTPRSLSKNNGTPTNQKSVILPKI